MSSRLASSSKSPPRRVIMPALPLLPKLTRAAASTPPETSSTAEIESVSEAVGDLEIANDAGNAQIDPDASKASPPALAAVKTPTNVVESAKLEPAKEDDVFGASTTAEPHEEVVPVAPAPLALAPRVEGTVRSQLAYNGFAPRPDRVSQLPNAINAQGLYPPDALIFVANLSNQRSGEQLELACHQAFDRYGRCHIKVRLDKNRHPFAFVQFERVDDANVAVNAASDMMIDGRRIRIERAKAERAVILSRQDGAMPTEAEARQLLGKYGPIEMCVNTNTVDRARYNMAPGMYIKFAYYLDCRDALRCFNNHAGGYNLYMAPCVEPRMRTGPTGSPVVRGFSTPRSAVDQKSIYVGNLPEGTTRQELEELFKDYGSIIQVNVIKKSFAEESINIFAFVEFSNPREADHASHAERSLRGIKLRIEPKEYSARRPQRTGYYFPGTPVRQNTPGNYIDAGFSGQPMNYNNPDMYAMQQMTTPPGGYNQGYPMPTFTPLPGGPFSTPPSHSGMGNMLPIGMFPPSPAHNMNPYGQGPVNQYNSPLFGGHGHMMGPIPEHGEEEY
ncbi:hypothetical protein A1O3_06009 [Capronia epimyces CBS 606.96]|uniref:RRM domain-containing protein n=1 Tax=Capronia epimyces CBS 606.96 TaxID=1182542 RepID=W9XYY9_9EURO|nr:uncharacterized protein A1O3_06009 [Capronia epimyces CBS 606.96]EXJ82196.1 hypothetical protein A1O3_06009 [Capronia epimyces CBS 606.96]